MCNEPVILQPFRGCTEPNSVLLAISPGISASAKSISSLPKSAKAISTYHVNLNLNNKHIKFYLLK